MTVKTKVATSKNLSKVHAGVHVDKTESPGIIVKPRGPPIGFYNRENFNVHSKKSVNKVRKDQQNKNNKDNKGKFTPTKLQFGFSPLPKANQDKLSIKQHSKMYFSDNIDNLQAPKDRGYHKRADKRSPKWFINDPRGYNSEVKKQDRKSNLDFLGIFDTRKYFFIPPNRRSETKDSGIISSLVNFLSQ